MWLRIINYRSDEHLSPGTVLQYYTSILAHYSNLSFLEDDWVGYVEREGHLSELVGIINNFIAQRKRTKVHMDGQLSEM
jgi:hypothetical protein